MKQRMNGAHKREESKCLVDEFVIEKKAKSVINDAPKEKRKLRTCSISDHTV